MRFDSSFAFFLTILSLHAIAGCGDDDVTGSGGIPAELLGTWTYQSVTINGQPGELGQVLEWHASTVSARFTLNAAGTFFYEELDDSSQIVWTERGTLSVSGTTFIFTITENDDGPVDPPRVMSGTGVLFANLMTITIVNEGDTYVFLASR